MTLLPLFLSIDNNDISKFFSSINDMKKNINTQNTWHYGDKKLGNSNFIWDKTKSLYYHPKLINIFKKFNLSSNII